MQSSQRPLFDSIAARRFNRGKKADVDLGPLGAKLGSIGATIPRAPRGITWHNPFKNAAKFCLFWGEL
jgi:hypothetical protein